MSDGTETNPRGRRAGTLGFRLDAARRRFFVGREAEKALFAEALAAEEPPFALLHFHGPGGVGKSALLGELAALCEEAGASAVLVDGRDVEPSPEGFLRAVGMALGAEPGEEVTERLRTGPGRPVLLLDTYEAMYGLDGWLRERFAPTLPEDALIVTAGRKPLAQGWRTEPGWAGMARAVPLGNLGADESLQFLTKRGTEGEVASDVIEFTRGHPLALSLLADVLDSGGWERNAGAKAPAEVLKVLLEQFVEQVPSEKHRTALEVTAHMRYATEGALADVLGEECSEVFAWLRELSFVETGPRGLFPHDLAREVLDRDLAWRNPERYARLHLQVRENILRRLDSTAGVDMLQACYDMIYLHRNSPVMAPFFAWDELDAVYGEAARTSDHEAILELVEQYEGRDSAKVAERWLREQPEGFLVLRRAGTDMVGVMSLARLTAGDRSAAEWDPGARALWDYIDRFGPMRGDEVASVLRFVVIRDAYHLASPGMNIVQARVLLDWVTLPNLAWAFLVMTTAEFWEPQMTYLDFHRAPEADFSCGGLELAAFGHDWRARPRDEWLEVMAARELATAAEIQGLRAEHPAPVRRMEKAEFRDAIREALREYARTMELERNSLVGAAIAGSRGVEGLREALREAADELAAHPRDEKVHRVLVRTYFEPAATQEAAAEELDLPFSTYRRYLAAGVERLTERLWDREQGAGA